LASPLFDVVTYFASGFLPFAARWIFSIARIFAFPAMGQCELSLVGCMEAVWWY
jgi:hypothetical protein